MPNVMAALPNTGGSMVDIQSAAAEIRRGIKKRKKIERNHRAKYNIRICYAGRP